MKRKNLSVYIDEALLHKLHVVADYEGRSASAQMVVMIRRLVEAYEEKHGDIKIASKRTEKKEDVQKFI